MTAQLYNLKDYREARRLREEPITLAAWHDAMVAMLFPFLLADDSEKLQ